MDERLIHELMMNPSGLTKRAERSPLAAIRFFCRFRYGLGINGKSNPNRSTGTKNRVEAPGKGVIAPHDLKGLKQPNGVCSE